MQLPITSQQSRAGPAATRVAPLFQGLERVLFAAGALCLLACASACVHRSYFQAHQQQVFEQAFVEAASTEDHHQSEWSHERTRRLEASGSESPPVLGRLEIPAVDLSVMVLDGTDDATLDRGVGRIEGTSRPGEVGNLGIAGHRDSFFRGLRHLSVGDEITLTTLDGVSRYRVEKLRVVDPEAVEVLAASEHTSLTLVTCYPFSYVGAAPQRFIVRARQQRFDPWSREEITSGTAIDPATSLAASR
jgi:sortase A